MDVTKIAAAMLSYWRTSPLHFYEVWTPGKPPRTVLACNDEYAVYRWLDTMSHAEKCAQLAEGPTLTLKLLRDSRVSVYELTLGFNFYARDTVVRTS